MVGDECDIFYVLILISQSDIASKEQQHRIYSYSIPTTRADISQDFLENKQNFLVLSGE